VPVSAFSKTYGTLRAVQSLDLEIGAGEVVALLGPNGSGKTTSLKAAAGLTLPTSGEVRLGGRSAADQQDHFAAGVAVVSQDLRDRLRHSPVSARALPAVAQSGAEIAFCSSWFASNDHDAHGQTVQDCAPAQSSLN